MFGSRYLLGTDPQGRDMLSAVIFGLRTSLLVGASSVVLAARSASCSASSAVISEAWLDAVIMRVADIQLSFRRS